MLGYLSLDIICSSKLTVFLELRSRKTVRFSEQIMSADKYPSIFSRQIKAILCLTRWHQKDCTHMNKTCKAIENITNNALSISRIVKIQTRNSYSLKIKKTSHSWGIFNSRCLMFTRRKDRREDIKSYSSVRDSDDKSSNIGICFLRAFP